MAEAELLSVAPGMCSAAYSKTGCNDSPAPLVFAIASDKAAMISLLVATHSNGFISSPANCRSIGMVCWRYKRSEPNTSVRAAPETNGYIVKKTDTHLGHCPHQDSERF